MHEDQAPQPWMTGQKFGAQPYSSCLARNGPRTSRSSGCSSARGHRRSRHEDVLSHEGVEIVGSTLGLFRSSNGRGSPFFTRIRTALIDYEQLKLQRQRQGYMPRQAPSGSSAPWSSHAWTTHGDLADALAGRCNDAPMNEQFEMARVLSDGQEGMQTDRPLSADRHPSEPSDRADHAGSACRSAMRFARARGDPSCALARSCRKKPAPEEREEVSIAKQMEELIQRGASTNRMAHLEVSQDASQVQRTKSGICPASPAQRSGQHCQVQRREESHSEMTYLQAYEFAEMFHLQPTVVVQAWKLFKTYDSENTGVLSQQEFQLLLRAALRERFPRVRDIPRDLLGEAFAPEREDNSFMAFLLWMTKATFSEHMLSAEEQAIRQIARTFGVPVPQVEAIKRQYDRFDSDDDGVIDFKDFSQLLGILLGSHLLSAETKLPESRVRSFWRQMDVDSKGHVDFRGFIPWYLSYFDVSGCPVGASPLEEFYRSMRPFPNARPLEREDNGHTLPLI
mmetsp:Transcript_27410/g.59902  ORF Transcript_27410/g.59902 Transcript_27410/m.59902 type:complete len:509 (+) Transcript_27410:111-1637(+)